MDEIWNWRSFEVPSGRKIWNIVQIIVGSILRCRLAVKLCWRTLSCSRSVKILEVFLSTFVVVKDSYSHRSRSSAVWKWGHIVIVNCHVLWSPSSVSSSAKTADVQVGLMSDNFVTATFDLQVCDWHFFQLFFCYFFPIMHCQIKKQNIWSCAFKLFNLNNLPYFIQILLSSWCIFVKLKCYIMGLCPLAYNL